MKPFYLIVCVCLLSLLIYHLSFDPLLTEIVTTFTHSTLLSSTIKMTGKMFESQEINLRWWNLKLKIATKKLGTNNVPKVALWPVLGSSLYCKVISEF